MTTQKITDRLRAACVGRPARIPWPHRLLHDAIAHIERMEQMQLNPIGSNMTEIVIDDTTILFSYKTPVACHVTGQGFYRTSRKWSVTTSKHVNKWLAGASAVEMPQDWFDRLCAP